MINYFHFLLIAFSISLFGCNENSIDNDQPFESPPIETITPVVSEESAETTTYKIIALGDSYTIGEGVCAKCSFPEQLKSEIEKKVENSSVNLKVIAKTGWTTTNLIGNIPDETAIDYDFATLLIGVNNQYQGVSFEVYEKEFPKLVNTAIKAVNGNRKKLIVISIPDYAYTPFGKGNSEISDELKIYNSFAEEYCKSYEIEYLYITDITENGFTQPELIANDNLHPSQIAYEKFVERLFPLFLEMVIKKE